LPVKTPCHSGQQLKSISIRLPAKLPAALAAAAAAAMPAGGMPVDARSTAGDASRSGGCEGSGGPEGLLCWHCQWHCQHWGVSTGATGGSVPGLAMGRC
jgi:hypothetical protein